MSPDNEYQSREDRAAGRPAGQRIDEATGKRQWKATVTDPSEPNAKRASFEITFLADVQPVPTTSEVLPGMRRWSWKGSPLSREWRATASSSTSPSSFARLASRP
ncbi:hypothetical protein HNR02_000113 [Amycolatopsis endophytica]|uniref:Uncharacterized protein n=1 Tax=Amycolatopsis endophytica TaxID=860233 RepID=A0A853AVU3_9PSEU|nr:hypothetical protein [Amycolatopsis endophytica]